MLFDLWWTCAFYCEHFISNLYANNMRKHLELIFFYYFVHLHLLKENTILIKRWNLNLNVNIFKWHVKQPFGIWQNFNVQENNKMIKVEIHITSTFYNIIIIFCIYPKIFYNILICVHVFLCLASHLQLLL